MLHLRYYIARALTRDIKSTSFPYTKLRFAAIIIYIFFCVKDVQVNTTRETCRNCGFLYAGPRLIFKRPKIFRLSLCTFPRSKIDGSMQTEWN